MAASACSRLPHSLEAINGRISFDAGGIRLDDVAARLGEGDVRFGGRIGINGFTPGDLNLTATGEQMRIRYPEGFVSTHRRQPRAAAAPSPRRCSAATVTVRDALVVAPHRSRRPTSSTCGGGSGRGAARRRPARRPSRCGSTSTSTRPPALRIENNIAKMVASADLKLQGTYDRPQLFGHAEIDRGDIVFEGNRYVVTRGGIDFFNPARIEPVFDIEAETRVRVPGSDLQRHARLQRHHQPVLLHAQLGSAAAGSGHRLAAARPGRPT